VIKEEILLRAKKQRKILHEISKRKANWIGHILRRNCLLQRGFEGKVKSGIEVTGRRGRRRKKLLGDLKERILSFEGGKGFGPVVRQTSKWNECVSDWRCVHMEMHPSCIFLEFCNTIFLPRLSPLAVQLKDSFLFIPELRTKI
jgi:hypothetical protein